MSPTKYKLPNSPKNGDNTLYWILAVGLAITLGWLWWYSARTSSQSKNPKVAHLTTVNSAPPVKLSLIRPTELQPVTRPAPISDVPMPKAAADSVSATNASTNNTDTNTPTGQYPRHVQNTFEAQLALIQLGISSGSLDGALGSQTRAALAAYQKDQGLDITGELDAETKTNLQLNAPPYTTYVITTNDLTRLQPIASTWLGKSQQTALDYETILELVAEKSFSHPNLIRKLNPSINWSNVVAGTSVVVPSATYPEPRAHAAWVTIHLNTHALEAFDAETNLIAHFPCSIAKNKEKRPVGLLHVQVVAPNPNYTFDPDVFPESAEARQLKRKLILPPGPNNPVGVAWIGLDKPGYGMHGTPRPEDVGRTESHGCFRLANWNAEYLLRLITIGTPVYVVE